MYKFCLLQFPAKIIAGLLVLFCCLCTGARAQSAPIGVDDGMYAFTTPIAPINGSGAPGLLANDTNADAYDSLQVISGTGTLNVSSGFDTTIVTYTPGVNDTGAIIISYIPYQTATGLHGNVTYVTARYWTTGSVTPAFCVGDVIPISYFVAAFGWPPGGTYSSLMPLIADSTSPTTLTAYSPGLAVIQRRFGGVVTNLLFHLCVAPNPAAIVGVDTICVGTTTTMTDATAGGFWTSSNPGVASISAGGTVTAVSAGTTLISYSTYFHTTFSWMPLSAGGCYVTKPFTVLAVPTVAPITPLASTSICLGDSILLADTTTGGTWSSSSGAIATIRSTGMVTGLSVGTATITYTVTNMCGTTYVTKTVTVNAVPLITSLPPAGCIGSIFTLTATPTGGAWVTASAAIASVAAGSGTVTCMGVGSTIITYTLSGCMDTTLVRVDTLLAPITGLSIVCAGAGITLTDAIPGGTWSSSNTAIATVSTTGVVTGVAAGTVIISYANSCGTVTKTIDVTPSCMCGAPGLTRIGATGVFTAAEITALGTTASGNFYITNNVVCNTSVNIINKVIAMSPGKTITVTGSSGAAVLDIQGSHLFTCDSMWNGVIVSPGNRLLLENSGTANKTSTLIENATTAVTIASPTTPAGYTPSASSPLVLTCDGVTFNKNTIGISVSNYVVTTAIVNIADNALTPSYPFIIKDAVFTTRQFDVYSTGTASWPYVWPQNNGSATALKSVITPVTVYDPPYYIDLQVSPPLWLNVVTCNDGRPASTGIQLNTVGGTTGSAASAIYKNFVVGTATAGTYELVLFDHLCFGINATASNVMVRNSAFEHMAAALPFSGGYGVYSTRGASANKFRLHVYGDAGIPTNNIFYDCATGVYGENLYHMKGLNAQMFGSPSLPCNHRSSTAFGAQAAFGYDMRSDNFYNVQLRYNTINNITTGINYLTVSPCAAAGEINISGNTVQATTTGGTPSPIYKEYVYNAIKVQNLLPAGGTAASMATGSYVNVDSNQLNYVYNGIYVSGRNQAGQKVTTSTNAVIVNVDATGIPGYHQYGIQHAATTAGYIYSNTVLGPGYNTPTVSTSSYPPSGVQMIEGIVNAATSAEYTECNTVQDVNTGFVFYGNCPNQEWINNMMLNNQFGMVLNGNIGNQPLHTTYSPAPKNVTGNIWDVVAGSGFPGWGTVSTPPWQTFTFGGILATSNKIAALSTAPNQIPIANESTPHVPGFFYVPSGSWTGGSVYTTIQPLLSCSSYLPPTAPSSFYRTTSSGDDTHYNSMLENLVTGQISYPDGIYKKAKEWMARKSAYDAVSEDTTLMDTSAILHQFMLMAANSRYRLLEQIGNSINASDFTTAVSLLASNIDTLANTSVDSTTGVILADDTGADNVVANYRQYYQLLITYAQGTLTTTDSAMLIGLTHKCPVVDGSVIYAARALYSTVFHDAHVFGEGDCDSIMLSSGKAIRNTDEVYEQAYSLYPNPNNGHITLAQKITDNATLKIEISNILGKCVYKGRLVFDGGSAKLQLNHNVPGLYMMQLTDDAGKRFTLKFTIN